MSYRPGDTINVSFVTQSTTGAAVDADTTPTAAVRRNGANDTAVAVSVAHNTTGDYTASAILPLTYSGGDDLELVVNTTIATIAGMQLIRLGKLDRTAQAVAQVVYRTTRVHFINGAGDPSYDGLSPDTANALPNQPTLGPGETILLLSGTFPMDTANLDLSADGVTGVHLLGAGMGASVLTSNALLTSTGCIVKPGNGSQIRDLTIQGIAASPGTTNKYQAPLGASAAQTGFIGAVARNVNMIGDSDGFYLRANSTVTMRLYDCVIQTKYDAAYVNGTADSRVEFHNCNNIVTGPSSCSAGSTSRAINIQNGTVGIYGGTLSAANATTGTWGVRNAAASVTELHRVDVSTSSTTGNCLDLDNTGASLSVFDCAYSPAKENGVISVMDSPATLASSQSFNNTGQTTPVPATTAFAGPYSVTLVFNDASGNPVPAVVFTVEGVGSAVADGSGSRTVSLPAGTFTIQSLPTSGTLWPDTPIAVTANATFTLLGTAVVIPAPTDPAQTTGYLTTRDGQGALLPNITLSFQLVDPQAVSDSYDQTIFNAVSNQSALLQVPLLKSTKYQARVGNGPWVPFTTGSSSTFPLPEILGMYGS